MGGRNEGPGVDELPVVEGLDCRDALTRLGGNRALYARLLHQFLEQESVPTRISLYLDQGDRASAERLAHTLKGVAGTVGAREVGWAAAELELGIREGRVVELGQLSGRLSELLARLRAVLPIPPELPARTLDLAHKEEVLARMDSLLADYDSDAQQFFEAHRELFQTVLGREDCHSFELQLGEFALSEAHQLLRRAVGS